MKRIGALLVLIAAGCTQPPVDTPPKPTECAARESVCGGHCVDLALDNANCGACGKSCGADESCANATCHANDCGETNCSSLQVCVDDRCVAKDCVGVICAAGSTCYQGACVPQACLGVICPSGWACVSGACVDVTCAGVVCPGGRQCDQGVCLVPSCPMACGTPGSDCEMACAADGGLAACAHPGNPAPDTQSDLSNCGACGHVCPAPVHSSGRCLQGACTRTACDPGYFDFDGVQTFGCEASCDGGSCTLADGGTVTLTNPPVPDRGLVQQGISSGAALGNLKQSSATHSNSAVAGEDTPPADGAPQQQSSTHKNFPGITSGLSH